MQIKITRVQGNTFNNKFFSFNYCVYYAIFDKFFNQNSFKITENQTLRAT